MKVEDVLLLGLALSVLCSVEANLCHIPEVQDGKIAQYYYIFKKFYFPMKEGMKLSVSCSAGHAFQSGKQEDEITCTSEGWQPPAVCFRKCLRPSLPNGILHNAKELYKTSDTIQYSCDEGFTTTRGNKIETSNCSSGEWIPSPGCHQITDRCDIPSLINGHYVTRRRSFRIMETVEYQCDDGYYTAAGTSADWLECLPRGWLSLPSCTKMSCARLDAVENGGFYPVKPTYKERDVVQFYCKENYSIKGSELIQCYSFGWDPQPPTCEERKNKCPPPPRPAHTILLSNPALHRTGDKAHYDCDHNYMLIGPEEIQCENGQWTAPPGCVELKQKVICDKPPEIENGKPVMSREVYHSGDAIQYTCADGYEIQGAKEITCKKGKWPEPPACFVNIEYCQPPPAISKGELIEAPLISYEDGSLVEYKCHGFHLMEGSKSVQCKRGSWSEPPKCLQPCTLSAATIGERNLELVWSSDLHANLLHGDMVEFQCIDGFELPMQTEVKGHCKNGQFQYPTCQKKASLKSCGPPPKVENSIHHPSQQVYDSGSVVVYRCSEYHFLNGHNTIGCSNGQWESPPTCIEPCVLSTEEMDRSHVRLKWSVDSNFILHGEVVDFLCKSGYVNSDYNAYALRSQCRLGNLIYPKCIPRQR
ncbi:coagulation factor XIII B chain-like [Dendropsophus ebraccatus]|uniref:coagulation factor XIII B chain-like n=1 Tax=Dendropsophus ebraccatus TaxID=150705 RepID=UPI003831BFCE